MSLASILSNTRGLQREKFHIQEEFIQHTQNPHMAALFFTDTLNVFQNLYKPLLLLFTFKTLHGKAEVSYKYLSPFSLT